MVEKDGAFGEVFVKLQKMLGESRVSIISKVPHQIAVKPKTSDDVSRVIKQAVKKDIPVVPRRATVRSAKDSSAMDCIVMDTSDMNGIFEVDEENLAVTVGSGVQFKNLVGNLSQKKFSIGSYPDSSVPTVGEWVDVGGAGIGSYTYGFAVDQVRTMEVVLPNGKVINTGFENVLPNSSGYNLNGLFIGAHSTLGIITKITLKMFPVSEETRPLYYTFSGSEDIAKAVFEITRLKMTPHNMSFYGRNHLQSLQMFGKDVPDREGMVMNITLSGLKSIVEYNEQKIDEIMGNHNAKKEEENVSQLLWGERFFDVSVKPKGVKPVFCETLIPVSGMKGMIDETCDLINKMKLRAAITGIVCDRSTVALTPYILTDKKSPGKSSSTVLFAERLGELAIRHRGRPVGSTIFLTSGMKDAYGEGINTILDIKSAIDPHDIMNPQILK